MGYIVYQGFIKNTAQDLENAFSRVVGRAPTIIGSTTPYTYQLRKTPSLRVENHWVWKSNSHRRPAEVAVLERE